MKEDPHKWSSKEVTPWFSQHTTPVRTGVYHVLGSEDNTAYWSYFTAETRTWGLVSYTHAGAVGMRNKLSSCQRRRWRGLNYKPKASV